MTTETLAPPDAAPASPPPAGVTPAVEALTPPAWYGDIADADLKSWVDNKNFKDAPSALKAARDLERMVGDPSRRVELPKEGEDITQSPLWDKLGVPKAAADYKLSRPQLPDGMEWDAGFETAALEAGAKLRAPPHVVQGLMDVYAQHQIAQHAMLAEHRKKEADDVASLYKEWGQDKDSNIEAARRAARFLGLSAQELGALETGLIGGRNLIAALTKLGRPIREGSTITGDSSPMIGAEAAKSELARLNDRIGRGETLSSEDSARRSELYKILHPKKAR